MLSVRPVAMFAVLMATAGPQRDLIRALSRLEGGSPYQEWAKLVALGLVFVALMLAGRGLRHPRWLLAAEAVVAGVLTVVPPLTWVMWLGVNRFTHAARPAFLQALAMAWLGVVVATALRQRSSVAARAGAASGG